MLEAKPRAENLWFEAFFIYCRVVYAIFLRSRAQKRQLSLAQRMQNCRFASAAKKIGRKVAILYPLR